MKKEELVKEYNRVDIENNTLRRKIDNLKETEKESRESLKQHNEFLKNMVLHLTSKQQTIRHKDGTIETFDIRAEEHSHPIYQQRGY